ncbi:trypco2 family protein [Kitasatospora sp. LaBMicrA B282]|uniref:trypco2 family protein n=1 Tax=Kitasatospora sp. LaBMicrA B282 TaxID=3420949 RepID=UPI003D0C6771
MDHGIELADAIEAIRRQLSEAAERGAGQAVQFEVGPVALEFTVELKRDARAKGGVKAWVLSGDLEGGVAQSRVHKLSVTLTPRPAGGDGSLLVGNPDVGSLDPFGAGAPGEGEA